MDPGAGSSAAGLPAGAVAVPVPVDAAAAAAAARPSWTQVIARATVTWAGPAGAGAGGARLVGWAAALFVLGCAAAGLALFATTLPAADSRLLGGCGAPTHAEVAGLRTASQRLLLAAGAQVLAATMGVLVPARPFAVSAHILGWLTADTATDVLWMLVACHDSTARDELSSYYHLFRFLLWAALAVGAFVSIW